MPTAEPSILLREIRRLADRPGAGGAPDRLLLEQFIERWYAVAEPDDRSLAGLRAILVWRFRSPHHSCGESDMRTSEPKPH